MTSLGPLEGDSEIAVENSIFQRLLPLQVNCFISPHPSSGGEGLWRNYMTPEASSPPLPNWSQKLRPPSQNPTYEKLVSNPVMTQHQTLPFLSPEWKAESRRLLPTDGHILTTNWVMATPCLESGKLLWEGSGRLNSRSFKFSIQKSQPSTLHLELTEEHSCLHSMSRSNQVKWLESRTPWKVGGSHQPLCIVSVLALVKEDLLLKPGFHRLHHPNSKAARPGWEKGAILQLPLQAVGGFLSRNSGPHAIFSAIKAFLLKECCWFLLVLFYSVYVLNFFRYGYMAFRLLRFKKSYCYYVEHYKIVYLISLVLLALRDYCAYAIKKVIPMKPVQVFLFFW